MLHFPTRKLLPTTDVYFYHHLKECIAASPWQSVSDVRPIKAVSPTVFICGRHALISRYATKSDLRKLERLKPAHVSYLIDDDIRGALDAPELPADYRERLGRFVSGILPEIEAMADRVVTPSPSIAALYADRPCDLLDPGYISVCRDFGHFDDPDTVRIAFLGTRSHVGDLDFLTGALSDLCVRRPGLELVTYLGRHTPADLRRLRNVRAEAPMSWHAYKVAVLGRERFHIAIAPMLDTRFNRARSFNKFLDHAAVGAFGLYGRQPAFEAVVASPDHGVLLGADPDEWAAELERCVADVSALRGPAMAAAAHAEGIGAPQRVRAFWSRHLGFELTQ